MHVTSRLRESKVCSDNELMIVLLMDGDRLACWNIESVLRIKRDLPVTPVIMPPLSRALLEQATLVTDPPWTTPSL